MAGHLVIAGASGFIGSALVDTALSSGYAVTCLVRERKKNKENTDVNYVAWDPSAGSIDESVLAGSTAVITLNGASLFGGVWNKSYKKKLWKSRINSVRTLVDAIARLDDDRRPSVFISGSAVGFYGPDAGDDILTEDSPRGEGFLAELCDAWEAEARRVTDECGVRSVMVRTGLVMGRSGGLLKRLLPLYKLGLGVQLGDGKAWMSTISLDDHVRSILHAVVTESLVGPYNAVCPQPIRNASWNKLLARFVNRKAVLRAPGFALKLAGDISTEAILASQRAIPRKLLDTGFEFNAPEPASIFRRELASLKR